MNSTAIRKRHLSGRSAAIAALLVLPLLVPPGDPQALAKGITTLLEQPEARAELGARAPARIDAHYSWERIAERTEAVYRELLPPGP